MFRGVSVGTVRAREVASRGLGIGEGDYNLVRKVEQSQACHFGERGSCGTNGAPLHGGKFRIFSGGRVCPE